MDLNVYWYIGNCIGFALMFLTSWATTSTYPPREVTNKLAKLNSMVGTFLVVDVGKDPMPISYLFIWRKLTISRPLLL